MIILMVYNSTMVFLLSKLFLVLFKNFKKTPIGPLFMQKSNFLECGGQCRTKQQNKFSENWFKMASSTLLMEECRHQMKQQQIQMT